MICGLARKCGEPKGKCRWCGAKGTIERDTETDNPFLICKSCDDADGPDLKLALLKRWW